MKFVMSYSCGKDSTLALHRMLAQGHEPVALLTMVNREGGRSFFHGADEAMLRAYSQALGLPLLPVATAGEEYHLAMEDSLRGAKALGAQAACFGDIDLEGNRRWSEERCAHAGLNALFPLWQVGREEAVRELLGLGYRCLIKSIQNTLLPEELLGRILDEDTLAVMERRGVDLCGENGEYHTLVVDGPIFRHPLPYRTDGILRFGDHSLLAVSVEGPEESKKEKR